MGIIFVISIVTVHACMQHFFCLAWHIPNFLHVFDTVNHKYFVLKIFRAINNAVLLTETQREHNFMYNPN